MRNKTHITISPELLLIVPGVLLLIPIRYCCAWVIAACVHELGHIIAVSLLGNRIISIRITAGGAQIQTASTSFLNDLICTAMGPLFGFCLLFFARVIPLISLFAILQTAYNLLPLPNHDGEHIIHSVLNYILPQHANQITASIRWICISLIFAVFFRVSKFTPGVWLLFAGLLFKTVKIPCKQRKQIVQ